MFQKWSSAMATEIGDRGDEHAVDALLVQGEREMMMIDDIMRAAGSDDRRDHVLGEELLQIGRSLRLPLVTLAPDLLQADRHLGWPQTEDRGRMQDGILSAHTRNFLSRRSRQCRKSVMRRCRSRAVSRDSC